MKNRFSLIAAALPLLIAAQAASAGDISIAWQGNMAQAGVAVQAKDLNLSATEAVFDDYALQLQYTNLTDSTSFAAFCIEPLAGNSVLAANYSVSSFTGAEAKHLAALYQTSYSTSMNATQQAAFQLAVWEFTQEASTFGTQTGTFLSTGPSAVTTLADSYVAAALSYTGSSTYKVTKLTSVDYQDLVVATPVPEPGSYVLLLAGLGAVGLISRRRMPR